MMYTPGDTINKVCVCQENEQIIENYVCIVSRSVVLKFWWIDWHKTAAIYCLIYFQCVVLLFYEDTNQVL